MIASKKYMEDLCARFDICYFLLRETTTEAFMQWYQDNKEEYINGIPLKNFDVLSVIDFFEDDLSCMYEN